VRRAQELDDALVRGHRRAWRRGRGETSCVHARGRDDDLHGVAFVAEVVEVVHGGGLVDGFACGGGGCAGASGQGWVLVAVGGEGSEGVVLGDALIDLDDVV
jgi:hypothetical protein